MSKYFSQKQCSYLGQFVKTFFVSFQASTVNLLCKATISVHDDGDVFGHRSSSEDTVTKLTNVACFPIFLKPRHRCIAAVFLPITQLNSTFFHVRLPIFWTHRYSACAMRLIFMHDVMTKKKSLFAAMSRFYRSFLSQDGGRFVDF